MTVKEYALHYVQAKEFPVMLGLTFGILLAIYLIFYLYIRLKAIGYTKRVLKQGADEETGERWTDIYIRREFMSLTQRFYELIFSGTSILFFMAAYYLIDRFVEDAVIRPVWDKYSDFLLLLIIILSCVLNTLLDRVFIRLKYLNNEERGSIRLIGMLYMIMIFIYIKFIYENNNYDVHIAYFLGLMIGRFVYFDASFSDFLAAIRRAAKNIPIMVLTLAFTGALSYYGFTTKYLIKHIGVVTNVFFLHIFMCAAVFVLHHLHLEKFFAPVDEGE